MSTDNQTAAEKLLDAIDNALKKQDTDDAIQYLLDYTGFELGAKRAFLFHDNKNGHILENIYEWYAPRMRLKKDNLKTAQIFFTPHWYTQLAAHKIILIKRITELRSVNQNDYQLLRSQKITSLIIMPLFIDEKLIGILEFDNPDFAKVAIIQPFFTKISSIIASLFKINQVFSRVQYDATMKTLISISKIYTSMHLIDLETDTYQHILRRKLITKIADDNTDNCFSANIANVMRYLTEDCDIEKMLAFTNPTTLASRMKGKSSILEEFRGRYSGWCRARFIRVGNESDDTLKKVVLAIMTINDEKMKEERLTYLAETDIMTELLNRGSGETKISSELDSGTQGMLALFDLNKFKNINDTYGHDVGDKVLIAVAKLIKKSFRTNDIVMRLGGDEFIAFAPNVTNQSAGIEIINRFLKDLDAIDIPEMNGKKPTLSIGIVFTENDRPSSFKELYHKADKLLYQSKNSGTQLLFEE